MQKKKIIIVDDNNIFLSRLTADVKAELKKANKQDDYEICAYGLNNIEGYKGQTNVAIAIVDFILNIPDVFGIDGSTVLREINEANPDAVLVIVSAYNESMIRPKIEGLVNSRGEGVTIFGDSIEFYSEIRSRIATLLL